MRYGDYVLFISMTLNVTALCCYAYQRHWAQAFYWFAVLQLNLSLLFMR